MNEVKDIAILLLELYLALGLMWIGFGYLFGGKVGGARAAQFYFARSLWWTLRHARSIVASVLTLMWGAFVLWIGRPIALYLWRLLRWLITGQRA